MAYEGYTETLRTIAWLLTLARKSSPGARQDGATGEDGRGFPARKSWGKPRFVTRSWIKNRLFSIRIEQVQLVHVKGEFDLFFHQRPFFHEPQAIFRNFRHKLMFTGRDIE